MRGQTSLDGHRILVVEDDYYIATDTARAVQVAGASVLGPYSSEEAARDAMRSTTPTGAVIDINLGYGPSFNLASQLKATGIAFLFITGYDNDAIPPEFDDVARLQKPVQPRHVVSILAGKLAANGA